MVAGTLGDGQALGAFYMAVVHGDGQVVPFLLWNGAVADAGGDVGESLAPFGILLSASGLA